MRPNHWLTPFLIVLTATGLAAAVFDDELNGDQASLGRLLRSRSHFDHELLVVARQDGERLRGKRSGRFVGRGAAARSQHGPRQDRAAGVRGDLDSRGARHLPQLAPRAEVGPPSV